MWRIGVLVSRLWYIIRFEDLLTPATNLQGSFVSNVSTVIPFSDAVQRIKQAHGLRATVEASGVTLKKQGREWVGLCPFHDERTPSFSVNDEKGVYYCRGCQARGDVIEFLAASRLLETGEIIFELAEELGLAIESRGPGNRKTSSPASAESSRVLTKRLYALHEALSIAAHKQLIDLMADPCHPVTRYMLSRGMTINDVRLHGLGFWQAELPFSSWVEAATTYSSSPISGLSLTECTTTANVAGYVARNGSDSSTSVFQGRLLFPICDNRGRVCAVSGRLVPDVSTNDVKAKYRNSPESEVFDKSRTLYGLTPPAFVTTDVAFAQQWRTLLAQRTLVLVEGYTDVIALSRRGVRATAAMGTAISLHHVRLLLRQSDFITLLTDGDSAGVRSARRALLLFLAHVSAGHQVDARCLPANEDPDTFCNAESDASISQRMALLPRLRMEDVWLADMVGPLTNPLDVGGRVRLERMVSLAKTEGQWPTDVQWQLALECWIHEQTGYWVGLGICERKRRSRFIAVQPLSVDSAGAFWLLRFARAPELFSTVIPLLNRWWVRDCRLGLLANPHELNGSLRLIFTLAHVFMRAQAPITTFSDLCEVALDDGVPSAWLGEWIRIIRSSDSDPVLAEYMQEVVLTQLWQAELQDWLETLDARLNSQLLQSVEGLVNAT